MTTTFADANNSFYEDYMRCISTDQEQPDSEFENVCLISNEPLKKHAIRLNCGHSFNYKPLLTSVYEYKLDQTKHGVSRTFYTDCPYCRSRTPGVLPYVPGAEKIKAVNMPYDASFGENICNHIIPSTNKECGRTCYYDKCHVHMNKCDPVMCNGTTKSGAHCKYKATSGANYCKLHLK